MPYTIRKVKNGYKVCLKSDPSECFSNKPLSKSRAEKQKTAIQINEGGSSEVRKTNYERDLKSGRVKSDAFEKQLLKLKIEPEEYLTVAKHLAKTHGYDPELLSIATDGKHKLVYDSPEGIRKFGSVGYNDYIIYKFLEKYKKVPKGTADEKRKAYHARHNEIIKEYQSTKYSPAVLALKINW